MGDLRDLYQEVILEHGRRPRHCRALPDADRRADGHNPLCGDRLTVYVRLDGEQLGELAFEGSGCAISIASASLMAETLRGTSAAEFEGRFRAFQELVTGKREPDAPGGELGKLVVFAGVREFPVRIKCATLAWHTLRAALADEQAAVTTE